MPNNSMSKTVTVALAVSIVCSLLVSATAIYLKPLQQKNQALEKKRNVLIAAGIMEKDKPVEEQFKQVQPLLVNLETGEWKAAENPEAYIRGYDDMMKDPERTIRLDPEKDPAGIRVIPRTALVYRVQKDGMDVVVLPFWGKGLWSTMYGFIAVETHTNEIRGLTFYQHGETPGLGGEVDNPRWKKQWKGKELYGPDGDVRIHVIKGKVDPSSPKADYQIDGLTGATITTRGIDHMVRFWVGPRGFGPFLDQLQEGNPS